MQLGETMPKPDALARQAAQVEEIDAAIKAELEPPAPVAPVVEPVEPAPVTAPAGEDWQHKYLTLQGKYNTEVPALQADVKRLTKELEDAKAAPPPAAPAVPEPAPAAKLVSDKDVENFGEDLVDLMRRVATEADAGTKAKLEAEIQTLKTQIQDQGKVAERAETVAEGARRDAYFAELAKEVPEYLKINADEAFIGWLTAQDPLSGMVRNDLLQNAFKAFDHARTATIFNAFIQETGRAAPALEPVVETPPSLEREVSPIGTRSASAGQPGGDPEKIWTGVEVSDFFTAWARGDYKSNPEEAKRIDREIDQAFSEGRVR